MFADIFLQAEEKKLWQKPVSQISTKQTARDLAVFMWNGGNQFSRVLGCASNVRTRAYEARSEDYNGALLLVVHFATACCPFEPLCDTSAAAARQITMVILTHRSADQEEEKVVPCFPFDDQTNNATSFAGGKSCPPTVAMGWIVMGAIAGLVILCMILLCLRKLHNYSRERANLLPHSEDIRMAKWDTAKLVKKPVINHPGKEAAIRNNVHGGRDWHGFNP